MSLPYCEVCSKNYQSSQDDFVYRTIANCKTCCFHVLESDEIAVKKEKIDAVIKYSKMYNYDVNGQLIQMLEDLKK